MMNIKYSEAQAQKYAQFADNSFSFKYLEKPVIEKHLRPLLTTHSKVIDIGCGNGRSTKLLVDLGFRKTDIVATDISPHMLALAKKSLKGIKFIESDLRNLILSDNSFDIIVSNMVLQDLDQQDLRMVMKKFYRWLTPKGHLVFIVVHPLRFRSNYEHYFEDTVQVEETPWGTTIEYYPKKVSDYVNAAIEFGFTLLKVEEPQALVEGKQENPEQYIKYSSIPTRLVIKARKK